MGPGATGFAAGDPVIVYGPWGCGLCMNCRQGMENYCQTPGKPSPGGLGGTDGGMAEYLLVPSTRYLIPLGDLDPREAAPLIGRGADQLSRGEALGASAGAGLDRGGHRRRRSGANGHPGAQGAGLGDNRCRGGYFGRQAEDRQGHGRRRGTDLRRRCRQAHQGHHQGSGRRTRPRPGRSQSRHSTMAAQVSRVLGHLTIVGLGNAALPVNFSQPSRRNALSRRRSGAPSPS